MSAIRSLLILSISAVCLSSCSAVSTAEGIADLEQKKYGQALEKFNNTIKDAPNSSFGYLCRASAWMGLHDYVSAVSDSSKAIDLDPSTGDAYGIRAMARIELGKIKESLGDFDKFVTLQPKNVTAYNNRACAYQCLGEQSKAIDDCNKAFSFNPTGKTASTVYVTRGYSYGKLGNTKAQMSDYDAATACSPPSPSSFYYRARAYELQDKKELAQKDRDKARQLGYEPDHLAEMELK
jgi:tetratricopeptide (TPR) repeat protein